MSVGTVMRQDAALENAKVVRFRSAAASQPPSPRPVKAVAQHRIQPRPITDEVVG